MNTYEAIQREMKKYNCDVVRAHNNLASNAATRRFHYNQLMRSVKWQYDENRYSIFQVNSDSVKKTAGDAIDVLIEELKTDVREYKQYREARDRVLTDHPEIGDLYLSGVATRDGIKALMAQVERLAKDGIFY